MSRLYALLVGINDYPEPVPRLQGCINDVDAMAAHLEERTSQVDLELCLQTLKNQEATRSALIQSFQRHLSQATQDDFILFAFSGHGSQEDAPPELWHIEPDHLNETLVCWDSRLKGNWDLADKELAKLIAEVAKEGPKITILLDCCHSGSGSRPLNTRYVEPDRRRRPIDSYFWTNESNTRSTEAVLTAIPQGRHILLAACRDIETAKEHLAKKRGVFSYFLLETLSRSSGNLTYRDVFKRSHALITAQVPNQTPQLEATHADDLDLPFLGIGNLGTDQRRSKYFTVSHTEDFGWVIDAGALHGIPTPTPQETTQLAVFPFDRTNTASLSEAIGKASVVEVLPQLSRICIAEPSSLREDEVYQAIATGMPLAPMGVWLTGDEIGVALLGELLEGTNRSASLYLSQTKYPDEAKFRVHAADDKYQISDAVGARALVRDLIGFNGAIADKVIAQLEHIARWMTVADLSRSPQSRIPADAIQMDILQAGQALEDAPILLSYQRSGSRWRQPTFQIRLTNNSDLSLYCALLDLTERYAISPVGFEAGGVWLQPGETAWVNGGKLLYASVPKELWQQGITEYRDIFKLIVCTAEFDARLMAQGNLDAPMTRSTVPLTNIRPSTLNRLMRRVQQRDISAEPEDDMVLDDWSTDQVTVVTVRPQEAQAIAPTGPAITLGAGVKLQPHEGLQATVRLTSLPEVSRSLHQPTLPLIFNQDSAESERLYFTRSRGGDPGLSVLELEIIDPDSLQTVTPTNPLRLTVPMPLGEGEYILPIAFDGEFFFPLGRSRSTAEGTDILLERLPETSTAGERSLKSTVRIFFQKLLSNKLGLAFEYPQLSAIYLLENGQVVYEKEPTILRPQVAEAKRILLLMHGMMGDTPSLIDDLRETEIGAWLRDRYDLILGLDYESFNTSVEETARQLKLRLEAVGLHAKHSKHLDVVGYELGGLIGRWLVEREGGHEMISHLVLVGTPGAGTPWSTVQEWTNRALAFGLNSLTTVAWPVKIISSLVAALEFFDVTIDQLQPGSELLKSLEASPNPQIPYSVIAGNAALKASALANDSQGTSLVQRLMNKLAGGAANLAFLGQSNDLFASTHSLKASALSHNPAPSVHEVTCDHFTYFSADCAQAAIRQVLTTKSSGNP